MEVDFGRWLILNVLMGVFSAIFATLIENKTI